MKDKLEKIMYLINQSKTVLITSHRDPDGDSIGSQLALAELVDSLGKSRLIINQGELPNKYRFFGFIREDSKCEFV